MPVAAVVEQQSQAVIVEVAVARDNPLVVLDLRQLASLATSFAVDIAQLQIFGLVLSASARR